jgi:hypothetical protein
LRGRCSGFGDELVGHFAKPSIAVSITSPTLKNVLVRWPDRLLFSTNGSVLRHARDLDGAVWTASAQSHMRPDHRALVCVKSQRQRSVRLANRAAELHRGCEGIAPDARSASSKMEMTMNTLKIAAAVAALLYVNGAALADQAARANTADPNSAPLVSQDGGVVHHFSNDAAARANTADPNSAPLMREAPAWRGTLDAAGRADTRDPG